MLAQSRSLIRTSGALIRALHRGESPAREWRQAQTQADRFLRLVAQEPVFQQSGFVQQALGEYAEALILQACIDPRANPEGLDALPGDALLLGIADAIGELRRATLDRLLRGDLETATRHLTRMESLFELLSHGDAPEPLVPLRPKRDAARSILEKTRGDVVTARKTKELERKIDNLGSLLDEAEGTVPRKAKPRPDDELDLDAAWGR